MVSKSLFYELGIEVKPSPVQQKVKCPNCKKIGKENYQDTCLSVNLQDGLYNCHKCGWNGCVNKGETKSYQKPIKTNFTKLTLDADTLSDLNQYAEYVIVDAAIKMAAKEETDVSVLAAQKAELRRRIEVMGQNRNADKSESVSDIYSENLDYLWYSR